MVFSYDPILEQSSRSGYGQFQPMNHRASSYRGTPYLSIILLYPKDLPDLPDSEAIFLPSSLFRPASPAFNGEALTSVPHQPDLLAPGELGLL